MMTGVNPGRHGVFDFTRRLPGRYAVEFVNATHRRYPTLWRTLSDAGYRVGVMGLPTTFPPEPVNGFMIAGFDAPVTTGIDATFVYPHRLWEELCQVGEYRFADFQELHIGPDWHANALIKLQDALRDRLAIAEYLLAREAWDCFMVLFGESDTVSHHFWIFHDPASPRYDAERGSQPLYADAIRTIYRQLDAALGRLLAAAPEATVLVLSDHGFGGTGDKVLYLNRWLAEQGYLRFKKSPSLVGRGVQIAKRLGLRLLPSAVQEQIFRRGGGWLADRVESSTRFAGIDWTATRAFSEESNTFPGIWLNLAGREPSGVVPVDAYHALRDEIIDRLQSWDNPLSECHSDLPFSRSGFRSAERSRRSHTRRSRSTERSRRSPIVARAWRREELYQGQYVEKAPDIVLELALDDGYAYTCQSSQGRSGPAVRRLTPAEYVGAKGQSMNGSHRSQGVLILAGPGIRSGQRLADARLRDVAPTLLSLMQLAPPIEMDGRVLDEALERCDEGSVNVTGSFPSCGWMPERRSDCRSAERSRRSQSDLPIRAYDSREAQSVEERLRHLGYLE
jgi:predicted AlkP superfamily phosphohydrolase/phosphomutase